MEKTANKNVFPIGEISGTKEAILLAAFELFGRFGYGGASVRAIAKTAGVNLAAINYHFRNKEELFWQVMETTYVSVDSKILEFLNQSNSVLSMSERIYDFFVGESLAIKNSMKMMLSEGISGREHMDKSSPLMDPMGPPGGRHLAVMIQRETPYHLSEEGMLWSIKAIFGPIFHWALMVTSGHVCPKDHLNEPLMSKEQLKKDVLLMIRSTMDFIVREEPRFSCNTRDKNP